MSSKTATVEAELSYRTDDGIGSRAHIGCIVMSNDQTLSYEARRMLDIPGVALYESRLLATRGPNGLVTVESLAKLGDGIAASAGLINSSRPPDVVAFGCTSGAMVLGHDAVAHSINEILPRAKVTDPLVSVKAALTALRTERLCFISPYPQAIAARMIEQLLDHGQEIPIAGAFHDEKRNISAAAPFISPDSIADAVMKLGASDLVDAVFVACTQMRFAASLDRIERSLGKPVICSNQALCWHALRLAGCDDHVEGWGTLFKRALARDAH
jgi:maleate isomerase